MHLVRVRQIYRVQKHCVMPTLCRNCAKFFWPEIMRDGRIMHLGQRPRERLLVCVPSLGDLNSKRRASCSSSARDEVLQMFTVCVGWTMSLTSCRTTALRRHLQRTMMNSAQLHSEFSVDLMTPELRCDTNPSSTPGALPLKSGQSICHTIGQWFTSRPHPCIAPMLRLSRCSQDVQWWHGRGALMRYVAGCATRYGEVLTDTERHSVRRCMCVEVGRLQHRRWSWLWLGKPFLSTACNRSLVVLHPLKLSKMSPCTCIVAIHRTCTSTFTGGHELILSGGVSMRAALAATRPRRTCSPQWRCCTSTLSICDALAREPQVLCGGGCVVRRVLGK